MLLDTVAVGPPLGGCYLQAVEDENAQPGPEAAAPKHVRKSEAHQRLKEANKQRRSLAGAPQHALLP